jgi:hypothetical protein
VLVPPNRPARRLQPLGGNRSLKCGIESRRFYHNSLRAQLLRPSCQVVGDGTTDNTRRLQSCLDFYAPTVSNSQLVYIDLPDGTFSLTDAVTLQPFERLTAGRQAEPISSEIRSAPRLRHGSISLNTPAWRTSRSPPQPTESAAQLWHHIRRSYDVRPHLSRQCQAHFHH